MIDWSPRPAWERVLWGESDGEPLETTLWCWPLVWLLVTERSRGEPGSVVACRPTWLTTPKKNEMSRETDENGRILAYFEFLVAALDFLYCVMLLAPVV